MSQEIERYLQAGTRASTRRSYQQALEHFEVTWGGFLPATSDAIVRSRPSRCNCANSNSACCGWNRPRGEHELRTTGRGCCAVAATVR